MIVVQMARAGSATIGPKAGFYNILDTIFFNVENIKNIYTFLLFLIILLKNLK
jgi:hypothetical protein